ncbi:MAG: hypothetical protein CMB99_11145 [Flavobacteriaceae bacterium]|nr:hypothetical protein [Flavobacteriaceae bacterium]|tara:strand:+ start:93648 stop:94772 length:1125 start_codon:yes stop_codon:yes gene_type:complete
MKIKIAIIVSLLCLMGCSSPEQEIASNSSANNNSSNSGNNGNSNPVNYNFWSIPKSEVYDGGVGRDGIPAIEDPLFYDHDDNRIDTYMFDDDLVVGMVVGDDARAYPHRILDWHEIVNDRFDNNGQSLTVTINYCPLTGTAFGWKGAFQGMDTTFGVSGLLYNTNLIMYDRQTQSHWAQMKLECVNGEKLGVPVETVTIFETTWATWKKLYPQSKILSNTQSIQRNYDEYPYGIYRDIDDFFLFPVSRINNALPLKERVLAILGDTHAKAYRFESFGQGKVLKDQFNGQNLIIFGNPAMMTAFALPATMTDTTFTFDFDPNLYTHFTDSKGNKWNLLGKVIEGPNKGFQLTQVKSVMSYWFNIGAFYENPAIFN